MTHILIPREPSTALLRPFIGCNTQELHEAWAAMVRIAEVQHARSGSQCLQQIEEPTTLAGTTIEQYARMFDAACEALGQVSDCLGINSDINPGAEPIVAAIEQLRAGKTHPVLDDRWKARMLDGRAIERDEMGLGDHPELPMLDEGMMPRSFFAALGLELAHTSAEDQLDWDVLGAMSEAVNWTDWLPTPPQGDGWKLVSIFDTEDGPVAWWLRELPEAEDGTTTIRILQAEVEKLTARIARAGAAPAAVAPRGEYPHEQMDAMALDRYKVVPSNASMLWSHAVVAGDGTQQLYVGREVECQNMVRKFAGAFLDGAFAFHSTAAAPTAQAAPALEAPAAPSWDKVRRGLTALLLGFARNPQPSLDAAEAALDAATEADMPLAGLRMLAAAPQAPAAPAEPIAWMATPVMQSGRGTAAVFCSDKRVADQWDYGGHPEYGRMIVTGLYAAPAAAPAPVLVGDEQADAYLTEPGRLEALARSHPAGLVRALARALMAAPAAPAVDARDAALWREHVEKLDALIAYCPTCSQGYIATAEMTRDQIIFECGKTAGRAEGKPGAEAAPAAPAVDGALPSWWPAFIQCVAELPDRNSPEGEPDAMIATAEELGACALAAQAKEGDA